MKLPLQSGRFAALKKLLVFVGTVLESGREQWSQLAGVPAIIEGHNGKYPIDLSVNANLLAATHVRLRVQPTEEGHVGVWGLRLGNGVEGAVTISREAVSTW